MKYNIDLKALEPKRWWHSLGINRKYIDFNIRFSTSSNQDIMIIPEKHSILTIDNISVICENEEELITNGDFDNDNDWYKSK